MGKAGRQVNLPALLAQLRQHLVPELGEVGLAHHAPQAAGRRGQRGLPAPLQRIGRQGVQAVVAQLVLGLIGLVVRGLAVRPVQPGDRERRPTGTEQWRAQAARHRAAGLQAQEAVAAVQRAQVQVG